MNLQPIKHKHSVCLCLYHFVTCTKRRKKELTDNITVELLQQTISKHQLTIHVGEIVYDHIHLMIQAPATYSPSDIAKLVKGCSSKAIKERIPSFSGWSTGYYISTTGGAATDAVKAYIESQKD